MARLTLFEMMNQGLLGSVRRILGIGGSIGEIVADLSLKFFGQTASTIRGAANFAVRTMGAGATLQANGDIRISDMPRVIGLPMKYRFISRVSIECTDDNGKDITRYGIVYRDTNSNLSSEEIANHAIGTQMARWFSGMGLLPIPDESACGQPLSEIIGAMRRR